VCASLDKPPSPQDRLRSIISKNVAGDFDVEGINGSVDLKDLSGSGVCTRSMERSTPSSTAPQKHFVFRFNQWNHRRHVSRNSRDIRFKSFNGGVYTDFPYPTAIANSGATERPICSRTSFPEAGSARAGRVIEFDDFNGDVRIRKRSNRDGPTLRTAWGTEGPLHRKSEAGSRVLLPTEKVVASKDAGRLRDAFMSQVPHPRVSLRLSRHPLPVGEGTRDAFLDFFVQSRRSKKKEIL
jgi:hypothetical protein